MVIYLDGKSKMDRRAVIPGRCVSIEPGISCHNLQIPGSLADASARK
jgi:hypothetical protein